MRITEEAHILMAAQTAWGRCICWFSKAVAAYTSLFSRVIHSPVDLDSIWCKESDEICMNIFRRIAPTHFIT